MSVIFTVSSANGNIFEENFIEMQKSEREFLHMLEVEKEKREKRKLLEKKLKKKQELAQKEEQLRLEKKQKEAREAREKYERELESYLVRKEKEREERLKAKEEEERREKEELSRKHIFAKIDISKQRMTVYKGGEHLYTWKISTGKNGYHTPTGEYRPIYITRMHYSKKYYNSPMPYSIFFKGGYAIHGTRSVSRLGSRASHGCVRLLTSNAKKLYKLVRKFGKYNTKIEIVN